MKYYLIVGEASGDLHASNLMRALQHEDPQAEFRFFGGDLMKAVGGTCVKHYRELAYMGFIPVLLHLRTIFRNMDYCKKDVEAWQPDVILIPSTGGAVGMTAEERLQPTELFPEMATLDCGTCNFGDEVFENTMPMMRDFGKRMLENQIKPEYECFEMGHLETVLNMAKKGQVPGAPMQFNFVLGVPGCTPATVPNLCWLVNAIPAGSTWTATGIGRHAFTLAAPAIAMGGNVRVGFEDNLYLEKGVLAKSNGELVAKVVRIAKELGREIATSAEARKILNLKAKG